jgi:hypothetical protein
MSFMSNKDSHYSKPRRVVGACSQSFTSHHSIATTITHAQTTHCHQTLSKPTPTSPLRQLPVTNMSEQSPYVTLISSDGYSFIVQRSSACISGAIKRMLDPSCTSSLVHIDFRCRRRPPIPASINAEDLTYINPQQTASPNQRPTPAASRTSSEFQPAIHRPCSTCESSVLINDHRLTTLKQRPRARESVRVLLLQRKAQELQRRAGHRRASRVVLGIAHGGGLLEW